METPVHFGSQVCGNKIKEISWPCNALIISVKRGGMELAPCGDIVICAGDTLVVLCDEKISSKVQKGLEQKCKKYTWRLNSLDIWITKGLTGNPGPKKVREEVFVSEQGFHEEFDEIDPTAYHIAIYIDRVPVATGRTFPKEGTDSTWILGRIAVKREYRGRKLGEKVVQGLEIKLKNLGAAYVELSAQLQARGFYEKLGYKAFGEEYNDEHCPHISMRKKI